MYTPIEKPKENKNKAVADSLVQNKNKKSQGIKYIDNRDEAVVQRRLQQIANNNPQAQQASQLQLMANDYSARQQYPIRQKINNTGLPDELKSGIEELSGYSMDDVKVHYNSDKPAQLQAHAYAQGTDIYLASGQEKHLPHEAWHVVQQKQGRVQPTGQMKKNVVLNDDSGLEKEADLMGVKALNTSERNTTTAIIQNKSMNMVVQRTEAAPVQIGLLFNGISWVNIPRTSRPEGTMRGKEGSHTTAWSAIGDGVRNRLIDKSLAQAIVTMNAMLAETKLLPGVARVNMMEQSRIDAYGVALAAVDNAAQTAENEATLDNLQRYVSAFLHYRSLIPLSAIDIGEPASYNNEGANLTILANWENESAEDIRTAIFELMDRKAINKYAEQVEEDDFEQDEDRTTNDFEVFVDRPGVKKAASESDISDEDEDLIQEPTETEEERIIDVLHQHLQTMKMGFPQAFHKANITKKNLLDFYMGEVNMDMEDEYDSSLEDEVDDYTGGDRDNVDAALVIPTVENTPERTRKLNVKHKNESNTVQVELSQAATITSVHIAKSDRPKGLFGSSDKKHATAWIVFVEGMKKALLGKTIPEAATALVTMYDKVLALPGNDYVNTLTDERQQEYEARKGQAWLSSMLVDSSPDLDGVQIVIRNILAFRNIVPFSAADITGAGPGGKSEGNKIDAVKNYGAQNAVDLAADMWGLLDQGTVEAVYNGRGKNSIRENRTDKKLVDKDIPGADLAKSSNQRAALAIKQHLMTMEDLFPEAYIKAQIGTKASVISYINNKTTIPNQQSATIANHIFAV